MQKYTSAKTDIKQVPALVKKLFKQKVFKDGQVVLDFGGGSSDKSKDFVQGTYKVEYLVYDKYNRSEEENKAALSKKADIVILSNVLNVIREPKVRHQVLNLIKKQMKPGARLYVSTYKAAKSPQYQSSPEPGQPTKKGTCWQNCQQLSFYIPEVRRVLPNSKIEKNTIVALK